MARLPFQVHAQEGRGRDPSQVSTLRVSTLAHRPVTRGDLVTVAATGDDGKPRPAVVVQTDAFPDNHASVVVCQLTSELADGPDFRVTIHPGPENGLRFTSQVMADKPVTVRRERIGRKIGRLGNQDMARLNAALAFVLGLAD